MARGVIAKEKVVNKIVSAFGSDYINEVGGKLYVWADDGNGVKVQIAISLTCPKTMIESTQDNSNPNDWGDWEAAPAAPALAQKAQETEEEKQKIAEMMARLGL